MKHSINWQGVVMAHRDFVMAGPDDELSQGVCLRDGCGAVNLYGRGAWRQAAEHLGFDRTLIDATDTAEIDMEACEAEKRAVLWCEPENDDPSVYAP